MPKIRQQPEDFVVDEIAAYDPQGGGDHTFLWVEKRLRTTENVARQLAAGLGVDHRDVGFAGRKDLRAVTRQWFSVPGAEPERALALCLDGAQVLRAERHPHKLRVGQLQGNRFRIVVRDVATDDGRTALGRLAETSRRGFPNRFGRQRFGRDGDNATRGARILLTGRLPRDRRTARFLVSALQSAVFNEALRGRCLPLDALRRGDVAVVHESGGLFRVDDPDAEAPRVECFEISPTGPIFGAKMMLPEAETLAEERAALAMFGVESLELGGGVRGPMRRWLRGGRRSLRARPKEASGQWAEDSSLVLEFELAAGTYATVLLEELFAGLDLEEAGDREAGG